MLRRIYVDNFRCLVNFELNTESLNLFLGNNGAGKSSIFEVLSKIQDFISGEKKAGNLFSSADCTRWQTSSLQVFELDIWGNGGLYKYELGIGHNQDKCRVEYERLWFDNQPLLKFEVGEAQLYRDDYSEGPQYPFDWSQSLLPSLMPRNDNTKLTWFKEQISRFIIIKIVPDSMSSESHQPDVKLLPNMANYFSWYRHLSEDQGKIAEINSALQDVLDGFLNFKFSRVSEQSLVLTLRFRGEDRHQKIEYRLSEVSDGQKALIALYTLIHGTKSENYTLCIDEPENFLALPEIQPWLTELYDLCAEGESQALLISHHPELINYLLASPVGYWFDRQSNAPVRVKKIAHQDSEQSGLPISELIARGWLNESA